MNTDQADIITANMKGKGLYLSLQSHYASHHRRLSHRRTSIKEVAVVFIICVITVASPTSATRIGTDQRDKIAQHLIEDTPLDVERHEIAVTMRKPNTTTTRQKLTRQRPRGFFKPSAINRNHNMVRGGSVSSHDDGKDWDSTTRTNSLNEKVTDSVGSVYQSNDQGIPISSELETKAKNNLQPLNPSAPGKLIPKSNGTYRLSLHSIQGKRQYMEDEYFANERGSFVAVMDGYVGIIGF